MFRGKTIAVVVPAYNEEGFVGDVIETIPAFVDRVYAVDDCSTDGTWTEMRRHVRERNEARREDGPRSAGTSRARAAPGRNGDGIADGDGFTDGGVANGEGIADGGGVTDGEEIADGGTEPRAYAIRHEANTGVGGAIKTGYRRALADGVDVTAVMNGDGQMDPGVLDEILEPVVEGEAHYAKGNRLASASLRSDMSAWRFLGNSVLTALTKVASGYWKLLDPQNGYTAISRHALETLDLDGLYDRYGFCNDVLVKCNAHELTVADVRMEAVYGDEESTIAYSRFVPTLSWLLLTGFLWRLKTRYLVDDFHPLVLFYLTGAVGVAASVGYGLWAALATGTVVVPVGIALLLLMGGVGFTLFGMVFDMRHNASLERRHYG